MLNFRGPVEAMNALDNYLYDRVDALPNVLRDKLREHTQDISKVKGLVNGAKCVYANRDGLPEWLLEWGAAASLMAESYAFSEMDLDSVGGRMAAVMLGETVEDVPVASPEHILNISPE